MNKIRASTRDRRTKMNVLIPKFCSYWVLGLLLVCSSATYATTYYIDANGGSDANNGLSWATAKASIQAGVDTAASNDVVLVANGTYNITSTINITKSITVRSANGASSTIIDGGYPSQSIDCVRISNNLAVFDGFTVQHSGGNEGVELDGEGSGEIRNCVVTGNLHDGVLYNHGGVALSCTIAYNGGIGLRAYDMGGGGQPPANLILFGNLVNYDISTANIYLDHCFTNDPHFVSTTDFHLLSDSPCINAGANLPWMTNGIAAGGNPRIIGGTVDIGAFEFQVSQDRFVSLAGSHISPFTNWYGAATNIQAAVDVSSDGDIVHVDAGTYRLTSQVSVTNGITITGIADASDTVVDGGYPVTSNRCFYLKHPNAVLENLTISNGFLWGSNGGGIYVDGEGSVLDCVIISNRVGNGSTHGGGVYLNGGGIVSNCQIIANQAMDPTYGSAGGIYNLGGQVSYSTISQNFGGASAGGIQIEVQGIVENCRIVANSSGWPGAGGVLLSSGNVRSCLIADNNSTWGGGVEITDWGDSATVANCTIVSNYARGYGQPEDARGGGILDQSSGKAKVWNSIIVSNKCFSNIGNNYWGNSTNISYSCTTPLPLTGFGNVSSDPRFASFASNDFHLAWNSPCIDVGSNQTWMTGASDLDGNNRILGGTVDMGVYETERDTDHDGIPDAWMMQYFGHPTGQIFDHSLAQDDPDGDGYTNLEEYRNGTVPTQFDIGPAMIWMAVEIGWKTVPGTNYQVQYTTDLASSNWLNFGGVIVGNGLTNFVFDTTRTSPRRFYRIIVP